MAGEATRHKLDRPSAVFDCVVFFQAAVSQHGPAARALECAENGLVDLFVSEATLAELHEVINRPFVPAKFRKFNRAKAARFLSRIAEFAKVVDVQATGLSFTRDPNDLPYLELAIQSQAQFLVTRDADLLSIPSSSDTDAIRIRQLAPSLRIVDPVEFLTAISTR